MQKQDSPGTGEEREGTGFFADFRKLQNRNAQKTPYSSLDVSRLDYALLAAK